MTQALRLPDPARPGDPALRGLAHYLLEHGSQSNAYFHYQEGLRYFHLPEVGYVSYHLQKGFRKRVPMVFLKPLCADVHLPALLEAFLAEHGPAAIFMGMDEAAARVLGGMGFSVNEFGVEFNIPIQEHKVQGKAMKHLRAVQHCGSKGVEVKELPPAKVPLDDLLRISGQWLKAHRVHSRELRFLTRPPDFVQDAGVRRFYCFKDGRVVGFVFFDPFFRAGRCIGYCANILRQEPGIRPPGILDYAILSAMQTFKAEGAETLALGLSPLHDLQKHPGDNALLRVCGQTLYRWGSPLYHFKDLAFHKMRFRGEPRKLNFCNRGLGTLSTLAMSLKATRIL